MDVYRASGRGGAGNYRSKKEIDDASKEAAQQHEAKQETTTQSAISASSDDTTAVTSSEPISRPGGRGGAGNFHSPPTINDSIDRAATVQRTTAAVQASQAGKPKAGLTGRGGVGNWADQTESESFAAAREQDRVLDVEAQVRREVEAILKPPARAYGRAGGTDDV